MDPASILREIGGGLAGVVMVVEFLIIARMNRRNETMADKMIDMSVQGAKEAREMHAKTLEGMAALTTATQASVTTAQAAVAALERRP